MQSNYSSLFHDVFVSKKKDHLLKFENNRITRYHKDFMVVVSLKFYHFVGILYTSRYLFYLNVAKKRASLEGGWSYFIILDCLNTVFFIVLRWYTLLFSLRNLLFYNKNSSDKIMYLPSQLYFKDNIINNMQCFYLYLLKSGYKEFLLYTFILKVI